MKKKIKSIIYAIIFIPNFIIAQDNIIQSNDSLHKNLSLKKAINIDDDKIKFKYFGFIRNDVMFDTRQTVDVREGSVLMWPTDVNYDKNHKDINAASQFQMLSVLSRLGLIASMDNVLNAKLTGLVEGDFFGNAESGINEFRLRHAWIALDWKKTQLGMGQYWHPLTIPEMFPGTVNFSGGAPFMPFNRNPQIRLTQKVSDKISLIATALTQRDFTSNTAPYINSAMPAANLQFQYKSKNLFFGIAGHFEQVRPKLSSGTLNLASNERLNSFTTMAFAKIKTEALTIKAQAVLAQNAGSFIMLGGFVGYTPQDGGLEVYETINTQSYWIDIHGNGKKWVPGFFAGYSKNNGAKNSFSTENGYTATAYGFPVTVSGIGAGNGSRTINYTYRIAPRIDFIAKKLKFGLETEYSFAQWGDGNFSGTATNNLNNIGNLRVIFATTFTF